MPTMTMTPRKSKCARIHRPAPATWANPYTRHSCTGGRFCKGDCKPIQANTTPARIAALYTAANDPNPAPAEMRRRATLAARMHRAAERAYRACGDVANAERAAGFAEKYEQGSK